MIYTGRVARFHTALITRRHGVQLPFPAPVVPVASADGDASPQGANRMISGRSCLGVGRHEGVAGSTPARWLPVPVVSALCHAGSSPLRCGPVPSETNGA